MNQQPAMTPQERLDAFLDGRLAAGDAARAQREFAAEIQLQTAIDTTLHGRFAPPAPDRLLAAVRAAGKTSTVLRPARPTNWSRWLAIAACILVLIGSSWWLAANGFVPGLGDSRRVVVNPNQNPPYAGPTVVEVHEKLLATGFKPTLPTDDTRAIAATIWRRTGQGLVPSNLPSGAKILGISETACLSPHSLVVFMMVDGQPLSLIVDKLDNDRVYCVTAPMPITPFKHVVGTLVIYEVTPHGAPRVREHFVDPQKSREWYEAGGGF